MSKKRSLIVFSVLLAALVLAYVLVNQYNAREQEKKLAAETPAAVNLINLDSSSVTAMTVEQKDKRCHFPCRVIGGSMIRTAIHAKPRRFEKYGRTGQNRKRGPSCFGFPDDFSRYGLENPAARVTVADSSGNTTVFSVGDQASDENYYFNIGGTDSVYTVSGDVGQAFTHTLYDLAALDAYPAVNLADVSQLRIVRDGKETVIRRFENGSDDYYTSFYKWYGSENGGPFVPLQTGKVQDILIPLTQLSYTKCVDFSAQDSVLGQYGLAPPAASVTIDYNENKKPPLRPARMPRARPSRRLSQSRFPLIWASGHPNRPTTRLRPPRLRKMPQSRTAA
jgi:hypothetical protein